MRILENLEPASVFSYFEELTRIPRGSGDMERVSAYIVEFAKAHSLRYISDDANNVVIYKDGTKGYEKSAPVILQGHLDMVCQKDEGVDIDFEKDGLDIFVDGDYIKARGTTLGADNGIAVAMMLAILERGDISHPPIEAVFTTDEEIGMLGAIALSPDAVSGNRMINIDSEDSKVITVSCAGGSDFVMTLPVIREKRRGDIVTLCVKGLLGGHSGVEIDKGRVNANILMGRILCHLSDTFRFDVVSVDGGDKGNAIPVSCKAVLLTEDGRAFLDAALSYAEIVKKEISSRESGLSLDGAIEENAEADVIANDIPNAVGTLLCCAPNGVVQMSADIEGLVETSLNLGILKTEKDEISLLFALRSNKSTALLALEERLAAYSRLFGCTFTTGGHYPPWEFNNNSRVLEVYKNKYEQRFGKAPAVEAIHAGLECGVFASGKENFDCISVGPEMHDIHTPKERLSISSTCEIYDLIIDVLASLG